MLNKTLNYILELLFPRRCVVCLKRGTDLCAECLNKADLRQEPLADWIISVFDYRDPIIKKSIWGLKYRNKKGIAEILAHPLYERLIEEMADLKTFHGFNNKTLLIPIPLSSKKRRTRGYNQSELLAEGLRKLDTENLFEIDRNVLTKNRETESQMEIKNRALRLKNPAGCFSISKPDLVKGRNVILIDDVVTTGATLTEAKRELKKAGVKKVIALTIAH